MVSELKVTSVKEKEEKTSSYFREVQREFGKITWVTKKELIRLSKVVLTSTILFGFGIYFIDLALQSSLQVIFKMARFVIG